MTIKQFAALCNCSTQTLRYYDRIGLLKPIQVDPWSGYRYYDKIQALDFVKIKNLQAADFSIEEIKVLLHQSDQQVYEAFQCKIAEQKSKLARIQELQQLYLTEKNSMEKIIHGISDFLIRHLTNFEQLREFGLNPEDKENILAQIRRYLNHWMIDPALKEEDVNLMINDEVIHGADAVAARIATFQEENLTDTILLGGNEISQDARFDSAQYETLWECHNWKHVYDFLTEIPTPEPGGEYCLHFLLTENLSSMGLSFALFMLAAMIIKKNAVEVCMSCSLNDSSDGENHFRLMRKIR